MKVFFYFFVMQINHDFLKHLVIFFFFLVCVCICR